MPPSGEVELMFSASSLPLETTAKSKDAAGFTMIELVLGFILIGILGAVAVPKYFDMQEQAAARKCKYNQSVLLTDMMNRDAVARVESSGGLDQTAAEAMAAQVMRDQGCEIGEACSSLCPSQTSKSGRFYVVVKKDENDDISYAIHCSVKGHAADLTVWTDYGYPLLDSFVNNYTTSYKNGNVGEHNEGAGRTIIETMGDFFTNYEKGRIDSDAYFDVKNDSDKKLDFGCKNNANQCSSTPSLMYSSMAEVINASLADQGVDASQVVWKVTRVGNNASDGYQCTYSVSIANKADINATTGEAAYHTYQIYVKYGTEKKNGTDMVVIKTIKTLNEVTSHTGSVKIETDSDGNVHYQLQ